MWKVERVSKGFTYKKLPVKLVELSDQEGKSVIKLFVALHENKVVGARRAKYNKKHGVYLGPGLKKYLQAFRIKRGFKSKGVGALLTAHALEEARKQSLPATVVYVGSRK